MIRLALTLPLFLGLLSAEESVDEEIFGPPIQIDPSDPWIRRNVSIPYEPDPSAPPDPIYSQLQLYESEPKEAAYIIHKAESILLSTARFHGTTISEALKIFREESGKWDDLEPDPAKKGVDVILLGGARNILQSKNPKLLLETDEIALRELLKQI